MRQLEKEKEKMEEEGVQREEAANCTEAVAALESLITKKAGILGLQVMGGVYPLRAPGNFGLGRCDRLDDRRSESMDIKGCWQEWGCVHQHKGDDTRERNTASQASVIELPR
jgi:hypothetical protein